MNFSRCTCSRTHYERLHRTWWMRLIAGRRLYRCSACGRVMFIRLADALETSRHSAQ